MSKTEFILVGFHCKMDNSYDNQLSNSTKLKLNKYIVIGTIKQVSFDTVAKKVPREFY